MEKITMEPIDVSVSVKESKKSELMFIQAQNSKIINQQGYEQSAELLRKIKEKSRNLETIRRGLTKGIDDTKKKIMDLFRGPIEKLNQAETHIKKLMIDYVNEQKCKQIIEENKMRELADKKRSELEMKSKKALENGNEIQSKKYAAQAENIVQPTLPSPVNKINGINIRRIWKARIVNTNVIPREYLIPNIDALNKIAIETKGNKIIPGVAFYFEESLAASK